MKKNYSTLAAAAVGLIGLASAAQAATVSLSLTYLGSTTQSNMAGLSQQNLSNPAVETASWYHVYAVSVTNFVGAGQALRYLGWDVNVNGAPIGVGPGTSPIYCPAVASNYIGTANPTVPGPNNTPTTPSSLAMFKDNGDAGTNFHDDFAMLLDQTDPYVAYTAKVGTSQSLLGTGATLNRIGRIAVQFNGPITQDVTLSVVESAGDSFGYFTDTTGNSFTGPGGVTAASVSILAPTTPEPASLGVLALGGLGLLARRRKI